MLAQDRQAGLSVTISPAANTAGTITLPGVSGQYHLIAALLFQRASSTGLAGITTLQVTTTNLNGSTQWNVGNSVGAGVTQTDVNLAFPIPLKSSVAGTNTTFVFPQPGLAVQWNCTAWYTVGD